MKSRSVSGTLTDRAVLNARKSDGDHTKSSSASSLVSPLHEQLAWPQEPEHSSSMASRWSRAVAIYFQPAFVLRRRQMKFRCLPSTLCRHSVTLEQQCLRAFTSIRSSTFAAAATSTLQIDTQDNSIADTRHNNDDNRRAANRDSGQNTL